MNRTGRVHKRISRKIRSCLHLSLGILSFSFTVIGCRNTAGKKPDSPITGVSTSRLPPPDGIYIVKDGRDWSGCEPHIQVIKSSKSKILKPAKNTAYKLDSVFAAEKILNDSLAVDKRIKVILIYELSGKKSTLDCFWDKTLVDEALIRDIKIDKGSKNF